MKFSKALILLCISLWLGKAQGQTARSYAVEESGPRSQRINIVLLSEGYTAANMPNFATHVNNVVNYLFTKEPWQQYRSYCNIYRIEIASSESGCDNGAGGGLKDTYFHSGFNTPSVPQLLTMTNTGVSRALSLLNTHVPEYDVVLVIVNDTKYGGSGGSIAVASIHSSSGGIAEHEFGHSFAGLADEYDFDYAVYTPKEMPNNTAQTTRSLIRWNSWIDSSTAIPTAEISANDNVVGLFEGSMYRTTGWYRPHNNSLMRSLSRPIGQVNREAFVLNYYSRVGLIDGNSPATTTRSVAGFEKLSFSVSPKSPSSGVALVITWRIDGQVVPGATSAAFLIDSDALGNGSHSVSASLRDPTTFVRNDPNNLLTQTISWPLTLSNQLPASLAEWRAHFGANDNANPSADGLVNLIKYALRLDPARPALPTERPSGTLTAIGGSRYLTLTVPRLTRRGDVDYIVEVSNDMLTWNTGSGYTMTLQDSETSLIVRDVAPIGSSARRFMRLKVREW
jgi:hypothetical protein